MTHVAMTTEGARGDNDRDDQRAAAVDDRDRSGDRHSHLCALDEHGTVIAPTTAPGGFVVSQGIQLTLGL